MRRILFVALLSCAVVGRPSFISAQDATRPVILNVTMSAAGDQLTISGSGFGPAPLVTIDGQPTPVLSGASDTQVTVVTPAVLLTTPGTYRLTVVDSVRQIGEVFVVASRPEQSSAVRLSQSEMLPIRNGGGNAKEAAHASETTTETASGNTGGPMVLTVIEDPGSPYGTAIGYQALFSNTTGASNVASGYQALLSNMDGSNNTATGMWALKANTSGLANQAVGHQALLSNTTGSSNVAIGEDALRSNTTGNNNIAIGQGAGFSSNGSNNIFLGVEGFANDSRTMRLGLSDDGFGHGLTRTFIAAIRDTTISGGRPVFIDTNGQLGTAGMVTAEVPGFIRSTAATGVPASGAGIEMLYNTAAGSGHVQAFDRTAFGYKTLFLDGNATVINALSGAAVGIGTPSPTARLDVAGFIRSSGVAGSPASGEGIEMLYNPGSGGIGSIQAYDRSGSAYKTLYLDGSKLVLNIGSGGNVGIGVLPNQPLQMASGAYVSAGGVWTNASSRALKDQIADLPASRALDAFAHLKPVTFVYKASPGESHVGFIAEDVPDLVATHDRKSLAAMDIVAVLTKVVQEQQTIVQQQQQRLTDQQTTNAELRARLARLESLLADAGH